MPSTAQWGRYGRAAGPRRNAQMLSEGRPDRVVAFHDHLSASVGTAHMLELARRAGLPSEVRCHR
jgi:hypothetical protein